MQTVSNLLVVAIAAASCVGCAHDSSSGDRTATSRSHASDGRDLTDGQVVGAVLALNRGEAAQGQVATDRTQDPRVREFAEAMVRDHGQAVRDVEELARRRDIEPAASETRNSLEHDSEELVDRIDDESGPAFDRAYVDAQVRGHQQALQLLDDLLIPTSHDPELRAMLPVLRAKVAEHLGHAQHLQSNLNADSSARSSGDPNHP